jgi:hypothetical protein
VILPSAGGFVSERWWKRAVHLAIGIGVAILWLGLRLIFPRDASLVSQVLRYARYAVTGFWVAYGAPWAFIRLKLR